MSLCGKPIWGFRLALLSLLSLSLATAVAAAPAGAGQGPGPAAEAGDGAARACRLVQQYGGGAGGPETIGSLLDLNMRQWKPQSNLGIGVLGWRAERLGPGVYRVVYAYEEIGRKPVEVPWRVDLAASRLTPLTPLSQRIQRMSELL
ncbi:MAG: hypothetical protein KQJ78_01335 [Deltaproteobacteria bacterium]|nr:hypothetical protein [Deltaproteobacteria bacterium]